MGERIINNNIVTIKGDIVSDFAFSNEVLGERFYIAYLSSKRKSNTADIIPIMVSERLVDVNSDWKGRKVKIEGQFRSHNKCENNVKHLILYVFAKNFEEIEQIPFSEDENNIFLDGNICKEPIYKTALQKREITEIMIAINRPYGMSDYLPCIVWGRSARFVSNLEIGTRIQINGRIQSREYYKKISDNECEKRIAYEVSASRISTNERIGEE